MLQNVIDALRRKDPQTLAIARAEAEAAPESADAQHLLGIAQREAGDRAGARASFERAIALAPDESLYHFSHALLAYTVADFAAANRSSAHAIALDPNQLGAYVLRIQLALAGNDLVEADRQLTLAERVDPNHPQLPFMAGQIALAKGDGDHAIELLNKAATARPNDAQICEMLGMAYLRFGHPAFAEQALRKATALDPAATGLRVALVESLIGQDRLDDADIELEAYRREHPQDPTGLAVDAELRLRAGDPVAALVGFCAALVQAPRYLRALSGAQGALIVIGDRALARTVWEEVLQRDSGFDLSWAARLSVAENQDDHADVLRRWRDAMPDSAAACINQAQRDETDGREAEAEAGYDAALVRAPNQPDALFGKAMYELRGDPAAALARLDVLIAHAQAAHAKSAQVVRGLVHDRIDHVDEAVADWRHAHTGFGVLPNPQPLPNETLRALAELPVPAATGDNLVVMLWGPPGSGSERLAVALRFSPSRPLLRGTQDLLPRVLQYPDRFIVRALDSEELPAFAQEVAAEYARSTEPYLAQGNQGVFDWLEQWDARVVPLLRHALPGMRLLAVLRDPRDMLLNWLAFGAPVGPIFAEPVATATWLANQLEHLLFSRDVLQLPVHIVDMDRFDADAATAMQDIAAFADLPTTPDPQPAMPRHTGPGRLPALLPAGRWRAYREQLAEAFAVLAPLAERLGYPRE